MSVIVWITMPKPEDGGDPSVWPFRLALLLAAVLLCVLAWWIGCTAGRRKGYFAGYADGYKRGLDDGYLVAWRQWKEALKRAIGRLNHRIAEDYRAGRCTTGVRVDWEQIEQVGSTRCFD